MKELYRIKPIPFLMWWIACSVFVWPLTAVVTGIALIPVMIVGPAIPYQVYSSDIMGFLLGVSGVVVLGMILGFTMATLQRWLLRTKLYWAADGWRRLSIIGGAIGALCVGGALWFIEMNGFNSDDRMLLISMPAFVFIVSTFQSVALRHAVKQAWLWILGNSIAGVVFSGLLVRNQSLMDDALIVPLFGLAVIAQGFITGYVMLFLFEKKLLPMTSEVIEEAASDDRPKSVWDEAI